VRDPRVRVQGRDNGRSLSACYWPIVADEREPERALPSAARNDTGSYTASVVTRPFSTGAAGLTMSGHRIYIFRSFRTGLLQLADKRCGQSVIHIRDQRVKTRSCITIQMRSDIDCDI